MLLAKQTTPRTAIPAGTTDLPNGACSGRGRVVLPTDDGGTQLFICDGCSSCRSPVLVQVDVPGTADELAAAMTEQRRRTRLADAFTGVDDETW